MRAIRSFGLIALCAGAGLYILTAPSFARDQQQATSLGEAAKRLREQPKPAKRAPKVWTNEDIPLLPAFGVNVVGPLPESLTEEKQASGEAAAPSADEEKQRKDLEAALALEKAHLDTLLKEQDLLQRDLALKQQQFFSNPNYAVDAQGKAELDALSGQIAAKQQEVQASKAKVAEMEAKLAKLKPAAPAKPPAAPNPPQPQS